MVSSIDCALSYDGQDDNAKAIPCGNLSLLFHDDNHDLQCDLR